MKSYFSLITCFLLIVGISYANSSFDLDSDKEQKKVYKELEEQLIENYLEDVKVDQNEKPEKVKVYDQHEQLKFEGKAETKKAKLYMLKSDYLTEVDNTLIYVIED